MNNFRSETRAILLQDDFRMACLIAAREVNLPDWYLGAGFLRNAIWDHLHQKTEMTPLNDVDLVYFDPSDTAIETEQIITAKLVALCPDVEWEVRNQARMHVKHGHSPYQNTADGISHWVEVPTCVGVRLERSGELTFTAPFGLGENWSLDVKINSKNPKPLIYQQRIKSKNWQQIWPKLKCIFEGF